MLHFAGFAQFNTPYTAVTQYSGKEIKAMYLFIYLFIHYTACSLQAMASTVQINTSEQEQHMKLKKGRTQSPWLGSTAPQCPVTHALVTSKYSRNHSSL
jgi:hypothetical protein